MNIILTNPINMPFDRLKPYNDLPDLPPPIELETKAVLKHCIAAHKALAELRAEARGISQSILIHGIGLEEAKSSSEIENIVTTSRDMYQAFADSRDKVSLATKEVLRYQEALYAGFVHLKERGVLCTNLFCEIATNILQVEMNVRTLPGTQVKQGEEVIYTPPEGEDLIRAKLKNLEEYIHSEDSIDPLIKLALIHYQFEAIHPFTDGNGRTGRIINVLYLVQQQLLDLPILYLSKSFIDHIRGYYAGLRSVTEEGSWELWITYVLLAVQHMALETKMKVIAIKLAMAEMQQAIKEKLPRIHSQDLVQLLFEYPFCKRQRLIDRGIGSRNTAGSYLKSLEGIGILKSFREGREVYFVNKKLFSILTTNLSKTNNE